MAATQSFGDLILNALALEFAPGRIENDHVVRDVNWRICGI